MSQLCQEIVTISTHAQRHRQPSYINKTVSHTDTHTATLAHHKQSTPPTLQTIYQDIATTNKLELQWKSRTRRQFEQFAVPL